MIKVNYFHLHLINPACYALTTSYIYMILFTKESSHKAWSKKWSFKTVASRWKRKYQQVIELYSYK